MKRIFCVFAFLLFQLNLFAGVMKYPRNVSIISTKYFEILFCEQSSKTAKVVAENADALYLTAKKACQNQHNIKIIVVISPDSEELSVKYTSSPYNRIVIYEGVPVFEEISYKNGFIEILYREIAKAVSQSVRSDFWENVSELIGGDSLQPIALMNMPFTFLEGAVNADVLSNNSGVLSDSWNLQVLSQMKLEGKIPTLLQIEGGMDIYPGKEFDTIVASGFCAYIQNRWGIEKFVEFWQTGGKSFFFKFNSGIFEAVYDYSFEQAWKDFIEEIPVPEIQDEALSKLFFKIDNDSVYKFLLHSRYGFVWYDELKKEVDIFDSFSVFQNRQLLFLADEVNNISLSADGRFLVVSSVEAESRVEFRKSVTRIFDLQERCFVTALGLGCGSVWVEKSTDVGKSAVVDELAENAGELTEVAEDLTEKAGKLDRKIGEVDKGEKLGLWVAGVDVSSKVSVLELYRILDKGNELCFSREFTKDVQVFSPVLMGRGRIACLLCEKNVWFLGIFDTESGEENYVQIGFDGEIVKIHNLRKTEEFDSALLFDFVLEDSSCFTRPGFVFFDENLFPEKAIVLNENFSGGINDAVFYGDRIFYSSHKFNFDEFRSISKANVTYSEASILYPDICFPSCDEFENHTVSSDVMTDTKKYNPWKYMFKGDWIPFFPVHDIGVKKGVELWPGLGLTFETQADPFLNNSLILSAGAGYLPMEFTKLFNPSERAWEELAAKKIELNKDFSFSAYAVNTSTPADLSLGGIYKFNTDGEYSLKAICDADFSFPLRMSFRRMNVGLKEIFTSSTSYWDFQQKDFFPDLQGWPSLTDSYRMVKSLFHVEYTNIHQYGISPFKNMGIDIDFVITSEWDISLKEMQKNMLDSDSNVSEQNLAVKNQRWGGTFAPTQVNAGFCAKIEIPYLTPFQNKNGWILSLPSTLTTELFYTNGTVFDVNVKILLAGKEIQNGFDSFRLYFPRFGVYGGYNLALVYDTDDVVLPDLRDFTRFYDVFSNCYLNDSFYCSLQLYTTPVIGKFSVSKLISTLTFEYFIQNKECKLSCDFKIEY